MSQPNTRSAAPTPIRVAWIASSSFATRMWPKTGPFFWESPVRSSREQAFPSRCAAIPSNAPIVTTPVPPIPTTSVLKGCPVSATTGSGNSEKNASSPESIP